jgi:hypothetical protein
MAIYDHYIAPTASSDGSGLFVVRFRVDFGKQNVASGDDLRVAKIKDGWLLLSGYYKIVTGNGASKTIDVGYSQNDASIISNLDIQTAGNWTIATAPVLNGDAFKEYTSAGYIWVNADAAIDAGVVDFMFPAVLTTDRLIAGN